MKAVTA